MDKEARGTEMRLIPEHFLNSSKPPGIESVIW